MVQGLSAWWCYGLAMLAGVMLALCFAPFDLAVMVWLGLIPLFVAVWAGVPKGRRGWFGFRVGYVSGAAFWLINLKWIAEVGVLGVFAVGLFLALYWALWGAFAATVGNPWRSANAGPDRDESTSEGGERDESSLRAKIEERSGRESKRGRSLRESKRVLLFAVVNACWWCGLEWVRGWFLTGFGWNGLGVAFHDMPILAQSADVVGVTGLSFLPVFVMGVVVQVGVGLVHEVKTGAMRAHWDFGVAMVTLSCCFIYGVWKLHGEKPPQAVPLNVLLMQLNIPQLASHRVWKNEEYFAGYEGDTLAALRALEDGNMERLRLAAKEGSTDPIPLDVPDWVLWPESALPEALYTTAEGERRWGRATKGLFEGVQRGWNFSLVLGMSEREAEVNELGFFVPKEKGHSYNTLVGVHEGVPDRTYRKQHLVVFGETIPDFWVLRKLWEMSAGTQYGGSMSAGEGKEPLKLPLAAAEGGEVRVIPTICFEDTVARKMRKFVKAGGQVIVNVTNDGWFGESEAAAQHFANAKFRSIEFRRPTVRCANTGVSAVINSYGTVLDRESNEQRILLDEEGTPMTRGWLYATAQIPVDGPLTIYARLGDWFAVLGLGVGAAWWFRQRRKRISS